MTEDVGTTKRKPLSAKQRLKMFEAHKGICVLCTRKIRDKQWIDEHVIPLALGGSNDQANRGPAHIKCAEAKTHGPAGDLAKAAKAKRQKRAAVIGKDRKGPEIQSAGFTPAKPQSKASRPVEKKVVTEKPIEKFFHIPRRSLFADE